MIDVTFSINGRDYTNLLSTYSVKYSAEYGQKITTLDGREYGFPKFRPIVTFSLIPLTESQSYDLYTDLSFENINLRFTDPNTNSVSTGVFSLASNIENAFALKSVDGNRRYKGTAIVLRQRTVV